jgi:hypothetical protein
MDNTLPGHRPPLLGRYASSGGTAAHADQCAVTVMRGHRTS